MAVGVRGNPFGSDNANAMFRLGSLVTGLGADEGHRFRNMAYAENARADIAYNEERTKQLAQRRGALQRMHERLSAAGPNGLALGDAVAMAPDLLFVPNDAIAGPRAALGVATARDPRVQAQVAGGAGGDVGNMVYGVDQASGDRRYAADRSAGATVEAARIRNQGDIDAVRERARLTPLNPDASGIVLTPAQRQFYGLPADEGTGALPPNVQGPTLPATYNQPTFLPGAVNTPPDNVRTQIRPGLFDPNAPQIERTQGVARGATGAAAGPMARLGDAVVDAVLQGRPLPDISGTGLTIPQVLGGPQAVTASIRGNAATDLQGLRGSQRLAELDRTIEGRLAVTGQQGANQTELARVRGELTTQRDAALAEFRAQAAMARDEAALQRLQTQLDGRLEQIAAQSAARLEQLGVRTGSNERIADGRNATALAVQGARNEGNLATQGARNEGNLAVQGARNDGALATQDARNEGNLAVQGARNDGNLAVQGARNEGSLATAEARGRAAIERQRVANEGRPAPRPSATVINGVEDGLNNLSRLSDGGSLTPDAQALVRELATEIAARGANPQSAVEQAFRELRGDGSLAQRSRSMLGVGIPGTGIFDVNPDAAPRRASPTPPAAPRLGDAVTPPAAAAAAAGQRPASVTPEQALAEGRAAIARGADRQAVAARLRSMGIDPGGL